MVFRKAKKSDESEHDHLVKMKFCSSILSTLFDLKVFSFKPFYIGDYLQADRGSLYVERLHYIKNHVLSLHFWSKKMELFSLKKR